MVKERLVYRWFDKEKFSCPKCKAGNNFIDWNEDKKVLYCMKCNYELKKKEELEDLLPIVEVLRYGFYLRFASWNFIPCLKCQDDLHEAFEKRILEIPREGGITLIRGGSGQYRFMIAFIRGYKAMYNPTSLLSVYELIPCDKCQKRLRNIIEDKELHFNNDVKPPVELWRKWEYHSDKTETISIDGFIQLNGIDNFGKCETCRKLNYLIKIDMGDGPSWLCKICGRKKWLKGRTD